MTPSLVRDEYRRMQGHWPQAKWAARLELAVLEGICLSGVVISVAVLLNSVGNPPLLSDTDPRWGLVTVLIAGIGGPTLLALFSLVGLVIVERLRYGLPPRNPPT